LVSALTLFSKRLVHCGWRNGELGGDVADLRLSQGIRAFGVELERSLNDLIGCRTVDVEFASYAHGLTL